MKKQTVYFVWACEKCGKNYKENFKFIFDTRKRYYAIWKCEKCGKNNKIDFIFHNNLY